MREKCSRLLSKLHDRGSGRLMPMEGLVDQGLVDRGSTSGSVPILGLVGSCHSGLVGPCHWMAWRVHAYDSGRP